MIILVSKHMQFKEFKLCVFPHTHTAIVIGRVHAHTINLLQLTGSGICKHAYISMT